MMKAEVSYIIRNREDVLKVNIGDNISVGDTGQTGVLTGRKNYSRLFPLPTHTLFQMEQHSTTKKEYLAHQGGIIAKEDVEEILNKRSFNSF